MEDPLCAVCVYATFHAAALIVYCPPDGSERRIVHDRHERFVEQVQRMHNGEHPEWEPAGYFEINRTTTNLRAVTTIGGTAVCTLHIPDAFDRLPTPNGRRW